MTRFYCCFRCDEVGAYEVYFDSTTWPRGHWLVCAQKYDAMVTGFESQAEAEKYLAEHKAEKAHHEH